MVNPSFLADGALASARVLHVFFPPYNITLKSGFFRENSWKVGGGSHSTLCTSVQSQRERGGGGFFY